MTRLRASLVLITLACIVGPQNGAAQIEFSDAQNLAVTVYSGLLAPDSLVQRIDTDLELIRALCPAVANIHFNTCRIDLPGAVCILLTSSAKATFLAGEHEQLNSLHAQIGTPEIAPGVVGSLELYFALPYHPYVLPSLYYEIEGVIWADFVESCYGDGDHIEIRSDGSYLFTRAWGDVCPTGCPFRHVWIFAVTDGQFELVDEYGDDVDPVLRTTWGSIKAAYR